MVKKYMISIAKALILSGIFYWLISSGKLNLSDFSKYTEEPRLTIYLILVWIISFVFLASLRWKLICDSLNITRGYFKMVKIHVIGTFFNIAMPGAVGGDFVKAFYLFNEDKQVSKTKALLSVFLDRVAGLLGLFIIGFFCVLFSGTDLLTSSDIRYLFIFVALLFSGAIFAVCVFLLGGDRLIGYLQKKISFLQNLELLNQLKTASSIMSKKPLAFVNALFLSFVIQGSNMLFFYYVCTLFMDHPSFAKVALVFPIGILVSAIPLAPGGLGVGHAAFEKLFVLVGLGSGVGARIYNIHCVGFLALFCLGGIPYLLNRKTIQHDLKEIEDANT